MRYTWAKPNPFLPALAGAAPLYIYAPAHYLKQFHEKYADKASWRRWSSRPGSATGRRCTTCADNAVSNDNPDLPTLEPWVLTHQAAGRPLRLRAQPLLPPGRRSRASSCPISTVIVDIADGQLIPAKTGAGEADLQARDLRFDNYHVPQGRRGSASDYKVRLWTTARASELALYPNLNVQRPGLARR